MPRLFLISTWFLFAMMSHANEGPYCSEAGISFNQAAPEYLEFLDFPGGMQSTDILPSDDVARAVAYQPDHKLVLAGRAFDGTYNSIGIARYHPDGSLDTTFDTDGRLFTAVGSGFGWAHSVAVDTTGRIVAAGRAYSGVTYDFVVARYTTLGTLDTTFGSGGLVYINPSGNADFGRAIAIQNNGRILIGGYGGTPGGYSLAVARLMTSGSLDTSFHTDGMLLTDVLAGQDDVGHAMALSTTGNIYLSGYTSNGTDEDFLLVRYTSSGVLDGNFDTDGIVVLDLGGNDDTVYAMSLQSDDKPILGGRSNNGSDWDMAVLRFLTNGSPDPSFNGGSPLIVDVNGGADWVHGLDFDGSGRILASGRATQTNLDFILARISTDGTLDTAFNTIGYRTTALGTAGEESYAVTYHQEKLVSVGRSESSGFDQFAALRYNSSGALAASGDWDEYFNAIGSNSVDIAGLADSFEQIVVDGTGKFLAVGTAEIGGAGAQDLIVARFLTNGALDTTFHTDGVVAINSRSGVDVGWGIALQTDGKILASGYSENGTVASGDLLIARWSSSGVLDTTFDTDGIVVQNIDNDRDYSTGIVLQSDGKIVSAGWYQTSNAASRNFLFTRFTTSGALDTTFGTGGFLGVDFGAEEDTTVSKAVTQSDGKIVLTGMAQLGGAAADQDLALVRILATGALDTSFHTDGRVTLDMNAERSNGQSLTLQTDGRIVVAGFYRPGGVNTENFAIARFLSNGDIDTSFGTEGFVQYSIGTADRAQCIQQAPNGKLVVAGYAAAGANFAIIRVLENGALDTGFDTDGIRTLNLGATNVIEDCVLQGDGRIFFAGSDDGDALVGRVWP